MFIKSYVIQMYFCLKLQLVTELPNVNTFAVVSTEPVLLVLFKVTDTNAKCHCQVLLRMLAAEHSVCGYCVVLILCAHCVRCVVVGL